MRRLSVPGAQPPNCVLGQALGGIASGPRYSAQWLLEFRSASGKMYPAGLSKHPSIGKATSGFNIPAGWAWFRIPELRSESAGAAEVAFNIPVLSRVDEAIFVDASGAESVT